MYNVFLVDDEPFILEGLKALIPCKEYNLDIVGQAINGIMALEKMKSIHVDILITDIKMPKMDGLRLIEEVKKLNPHCKFIILSGFNDFEFLKEGIKLGIENYLIKPINTDELLSTLNNCIIKLEKAIEPMIPIGNKEWHILRTNIMNRWMNGTISFDELQNRAELLDICVDSTCYNVALIDLSQKVLKPTVYSEIYQLCYDMTTQDNHIIAYENLDSNMVLVFSNPPSQDRETYIHSLLTKLYDTISRNYNLKPYITMGETRDCYTKAPESYKDAIELLDYFLIFPDKMILSNQDINMAPTQSPLEIGIEHNKINAFITSNHEDKLYVYIDELFDQAKNTPGITPDSIRNLAVEFIFSLTRIMAPSENLLSDRYSSILASFLEIKDFNAFKEKVQYICKEAILHLKEKSSNHNPIIQDVVNYIHDNYNKDLSLKTLGYDFNVNSTYLGQLFKKEMDDSFPNYINMYRVEKAKSFMLETNLKTSQISKKVGYHDPNYFYRIFKKYVGISPKEFKMLHK